MSGAGFTAGSLASIEQCSSDPTQPQILFLGNDIPVSCSTLALTSISATGGWRDPDHHGRDRRAAHRGHADVHPDRDHSTTSVIRGAPPRETPDDRRGQVPVPAHRGPAGRRRLPACSPSVTRPATGPSAPSSSAPRGFPRPRRPEPPPRPVRTTDDRGHDNDDRRDDHHHDRRHDHDDRRHDHHDRARRPRTEAPTTTTEAPTTTTEAPTTTTEAPTTTTEAPTTTTTDDQYPARRPAHRGLRAVLPGHPGRATSSSTTP